MEERYLFKGKRLDNGEWVQGFYFYMTHPDGRHTHHFLIPIGTDLSIGTPIEKIQTEVDPSTICQCTGLKDKNGNLIFENSIVKIGGFFPTVNGEYKVIFDKVNHCLALSRSICYINSYFTFFDLNGFSGNCEVIGNVFDNPDLLEVKE